MKHFTGIMEDLSKRNIAYNNLAMVNIIQSRFTPLPSEIYQLNLVDLGQVSTSATTNLEKFIFANKISLKCC